MKSALIALLAFCLCLPLVGDEDAKKKFEETKAEKGDASAQLNLGYMYFSGKGVPNDQKEAAKWIRKAAEQGYTSAQSNLVLMYFRVIGVLRDYVTAYAWANIAQANGGQNAQKFKSEYLDPKMTPEQIAKAQELSKEMIKKNPKLLNK